ncbi:MAG TPA: suppressor of fused domain protein [Mycobacteriales bacterium]|nr:suppressor of fused domain protein [Mycobacteriales bacterium]
MTGDEVLQLVEAHLVSVLGPPSGRAAVSFLGTEQVEVLRFSDGVARYVTLGMSRYPMADPGTELVAQHGPRAELVLSVRGAQDSVLRRMAVMAASPAVEGVVISGGAGLELGEPLWDGARFTAVLVGEPGGLVPDLPVEGDEPVRFLPLLPMTPNEAAWKRVHGAAALEDRWLAQGLDLRDPARPAADLG